MIERFSRLTAFVLLTLAVTLPGSVSAQERLPWQRSDPYRPAEDAAPPPPYNGGYGQGAPAEPYQNPPPRRASDDVYRPPAAAGGYEPRDAYSRPPAREGDYADSRPYDAPPRARLRPALRAAAQRRLSRR